MSFGADSLTVFAVLVPALQSDWTEPLWIALAVVCLFAWGLIAADARQRREQPEIAREKPAPAVRPSRTNTLVF